MRFKSIVVLVEDEKADAVVKAARVAAAADVIEASEDARAAYAGGLRLTVAFGALTPIIFVMGYGMVVT